MKILVATALTQGMASNDYHYCVEGELVWIQEPCARGRDNPDGGCGCGRGFAGAASHRATTTAMVVESQMTPDDMVLAFETSLGDGGWPTAWARDVAHENMELAGRLTTGTVIHRRLDAVCVRAETLSD
ncbi:hypothetical protein CIW52_16435 [Mycolicibacterium sp. P9-64]|uniref:DUF7715 family protein n=1 Tax=Mycolicibacterium sp. P9-64 TaxID=2024612 RepID=UPI0011ED932A|nr:hypothetical protein [Mycolicibacterium sp. P9-64]KAA0082832.1 hypothetical protein CIW52_16435 [Mycolicibacterium sp. P9-64]